MVRTAQSNSSMNGMPKTCYEMAGASKGFPAENRSPALQVLWSARAQVCVSSSHLRIHLEYRVPVRYWYIVPVSPPDIKYNINDIKYNIGIYVHRSKKLWYRPRYRIQYWHIRISNAYIPDIRYYMLHTCWYAVQVTPRRRPAKSSSDPEICLCV